MSYEVLLLGAKSSEPGATEALAETIAARYGVPTEALMSRLVAGSFRVKSNTDLDTAKRYVRDLQALGAIAEVRDATTGELVGGGIVEVATTPVEAPKRSGGKNDEPEGLAAASGTFHQDLGALGRGSLSLATLDGEDDEPIPLDLALPSFAPNPSGQVVARDVPSGAASEAASRAASEGTGSAFAPPTNEVAEEELLLAIDPHSARASSQGGTMADERPSPGAASPSGSMSALGVADMAPSHRRAKPPAFITTVLAARAELAARGRGAFIAGVAISALFGLLLAHLVAVFQETSAYAPVRSDLRAAYGEATNADAYAALPEIRAGTLDLINSRQRKIAVTGLMLWLIGAGIAAGIWFRVVPWERVGLRSSSP